MPLPLSYSSRFSSPTQARLHIIGLVSVLAYAGFWIINLDISRSFEPLLMLAYLIALALHPQRKAAIKDPLWWLLGLWILLQFFTLPFAFERFPDYAKEQINDVRGYTKLFLILPVAWVLAARHRYGMWMLAVLFIGMLIGSLWHGEGLRLMHIIEQGQRPTLGFHNWEHAGVSCGVVLIALTCFAGRFMAWTASRRNKALAWLARLGYVMLFALAAFGELIVQTRASWLGLVVAFIMGIAGLLILLRKQNAYRHPAIRRNVLAGLVAFVALASIAGTLYGEKISNRVFAEHHIMEEILEGNLHNVPYSSIGFRIHVWNHALEWISERPLTGWGPQSHKPLIISSGMPERIVIGQNLTHTHNSYLELLVAYGFLGLAIYVAVAVEVARSAWQSWRRGDMPTDVMAFASLFFIFWLIVNLFESYFMYRTGVYFHALIGGLVYSYGIRRRMYPSVVQVPT
ncbi:O-antigen ligase family protein [Phytohalomonas tamaricis]|uniref:O-antigen ligase family protein n=1 Tax=Phytohalomonas tamaricis TaxID=2081032 RepID=UPI000D0AF3FA|nr:O-antigen ligase family protein [Phytohalomonas tamaricis]